MENQISSLEAKINCSSSPIEKIHLKILLAGEIRAINIAQSLEICKEVISLCNEFSYPEGAALGYRNAGVSCRLLSRYDEAFEYFGKALDIYNELNDESGKAKVYNSIGNIYLNLSDYKYSLEYLHKCLSIAERSDDRQFEANVLINIGLAYQELGDYTSSLEYNLKSMQICANNELPVPESLMNNIGIVYQNLGEYSTSLEYFNASLKLAGEKDNQLDTGYSFGNISIVHSQMGHYTEALEYLNKSLEIFKNLGNRQAEANAYLNIGKEYRELNDFEKAIEYELKALSLHEEISDLSGKASTLILIGNIYFSMEDLQKARDYYVKGLRVAQDIGDTINETEAYLQLGILFTKTGNKGVALDNLFMALGLAESRGAKKELSRVHLALYEIYKSGKEYDTAFGHFEDHFILEKEIHNIESDRKLKSLSIHHQYQNSEKERKIALQEKEIYRLKNVELAEANSRLIKLNEEKNEFIGIAAHDLKNPLSGILIYSKKLHKQTDKYTKEQISQMAAEMEFASEKMFKLIAKYLDINLIESGRKNFKPSVFDAAAKMKNILKEHKHHADSKNITLELQCNEPLELCSDADSAGQILENLVSNAVKFTFPGKKVIVSAYRTRNKLRVEVKDEGPGLTNADKEKLFVRFARLSAKPTGNEISTGLGLSIAHKLTLMLGGNIWCESETGNGASFIVEIPDIKKPI
ncbi:MAG TPA: tetratricopeptide repeat-containing sensor histidine kinase [Ignavibacteria bacterium]|nr:tetratricopeptide repeat-containing sensor histidine kinase [Ignavibacteria bacterium]HMQ99987.1 tetratricopeptide repeat-containing sensor histidine kinase [Ignavibacteria bacterium]